ncbi:MAG: methionyl-tRNA formyltransferase [Acidimicrobiia bacterium]|nr:methionyl-tRNA formyltransferase [Acidimicrobiia bacterium]
MKLVYFGTPAAAVPPLEALAAAGHEIALVVTQPDRRRGRGSGLVPSPVKAAAEALGLPIVTPEKSGEIVDEVRALQADLGVVVAFGQLLPQALLDAIPGGLVNVHFSLLPRWRGAAPVERAILADDRETGVCIMGVELALDAGPVYAREVLTIAPTETAGELHGRLAAAGTELLVRTVPRVAEVEPEPQRGDAVYAEKLTVDEFELDLNRPPAELVRLVRAANPRPGAWLEIAGARCKVWTAHVEGDRFVPDEIQPAGKARMAYTAWRTGHRDADPFA